MNEQSRESDRLSKYGCFDTFGTDLLRAARAEQNGAGRSLRRKAVVPLMALTLIGVPASLAGAGVIGGNDVPVDELCSQSNPEMNQAVSQQKKRVREQLREHPELSDVVLEGVTVQSHDGKSVRVPVDEFERLQCPE